MVAKTVSQTCEQVPPGTLVLVLLATVLPCPIICSYVLEDKWLSLLPNTLGRNDTRTNTQDLNTNFH